MSKQRAAAAYAPRNGTPAKSTSKAGGCGAKTSTRDPYLKVLGPETGVFEFDLTGSSVTIGRSDDADLTLPDNTVSRLHARIFVSNGRYKLEDVGSTHGTTVNGKPIDSHTLQHGDSIVIGMYQIEFRTHDELPGAMAAAARAKLLLRNEYCMLPSNAPLKFRVLEVAAQDAFQSGDTLELGCGGVLIPTATQPADDTCLELNVSWPNQTSTRYLGEIQGVIFEEPNHWLCVKLHGLPPSLHQAIVKRSKPGPWTNALN